MLKHDPFEDTREYELIKEELDALIKQEIGEGGYMGYCHRYWGAKKRILKEKYGVEWSSPSELNSQVMFD